MEKSERRKQKRYAVKDVAFVVLKTNTDEELGQIINISEGGLAFQYFVGNRTLQHSNQLDILLPDNGLNVAKIHFKPVADYELSSELPFSSITKRQQSVEFCLLNDNQLNEIKEFIDTHTYHTKD